MGKIIVTPQGIDAPEAVVEYDGLLDRWLKTPVILNTIRQVYGPHGEIEYDVESGDMVFVYLVTQNERIFIATCRVE